MKTPSRAKSPRSKKKSSSLIVSEPPKQPWYRDPVKVGAVLGVAVTIVKLVKELLF
jgi:hypothetical protein